MWELECQVDDMGNFFVLFNQILFKSTDFLMIGVLILLVDFDHRWGSLHKIDSKVLEILKQRLKSFNDDSLSIFDKKKVP